MYSLLWGHPLEHILPHRGHRSLKELTLLQNPSTVNSSSARGEALLISQDSMLECSLAWSHMGTIAAVSSWAQCPVMPRRQCFALVLPDLCLFSSFSPIFCDGPWALDRQMSHRYPIFVWASHWLILLPVVSFCINFHPFHKSLERYVE